MQGPKKVPYQILGVQVRTLTTALAFLIPLTYGLLVRGLHSHHVAISVVRVQ